MSQYIHIPFAVMLLIAVSWTTLFSLTSNPGIRGFRNLGILASYVLALVFFFVAGWRQALVTWAVFGVVGGAIYTLWEVLQRLRAPAGEKKPPVNLSHLFYGLSAWPVMVPEAIEYTLAELGVLRTPPISPPGGTAESTPDSFFEETDQRLQRMVDCLAASEVVEISGVVDPLGASGGKSRGEDLWTFLFSLTPWRHPDGDLDDRSLTVRKLVTEEELESLQDTVSPYDVIRVKAHYSEECAREAGFDDPQALLVQVVARETTDDELNSMASSLQEPVVITDPFFGELELDRGLNWLEGVREWGAEDIEVRFSLDECEDQDALIRSAESLWADQPRWDSRIQGFIVEKLLPLKNDQWLDVDEEELSPAEFREVIEPDSVMFYPDGSFEFSLDDGDLFSGHILVVGGTVAGDLTDVSVEG